MTVGLSVYANVSAWSIANAATRDVEAPAELLAELAHAMFNVTVYGDGELEDALRSEAAKDDKRRRALAQLGALLTAAVGTPEDEHRAWMERTAASVAHDGDFSPV